MEKLFAWEKMLLVNHRLPLKKNKAAIIDNVCRRYVLKPEDLLTVGITPIGIFLRSTQAFPIEVYPEGKIKELQDSNDSLKSYFQ